MTDEPESPPIDHTIDAMRYMMQVLRKPRPMLPTILTSEQTKDALGVFPNWRVDDFNLTDEQMKVFGVDFGTKVAAVMVTWAHDGARYTPITFEELFDPAEDGEGQ